MGRGAVLAVAGLCAGLAATARVQIAQAQIAQAQAAPPSAADSARLSLFAAAFAKAPPSPSPGRRTAMAFLPGRGVVAWDVTGKTPDQAREAEVEAMGLADARAVQREIDAAADEKRAERRREAMQRRALGAGSVRRVALALPTVVDLPREAASALAPGHAAPRGNLLDVRSGDALHGQPRVFAFAAASGREVGFNVAHEDAGWRNAGLTADPGGFAGQRQAGLAWRKGVVRTSVSYEQQKDRMEILGVQTDKDHRVMLTMAMPPQAILGLFAKKP